MKHYLIAAIALTGAFALGACAEDYGPAGPYADVDFTGYYDDYYGPFYGGYWAAGGVFYYADRDGRHFHRDNDHHFRNDAGAGFHPIQGHAPAPRGPGGRGHDGGRRTSPPRP